MSRDRRKALISVESSRLSVMRQCELVDISRSSYYYTPSGESEFNLKVMSEIDHQFLETPFYGSRQMARHLRRRGYDVGRTRIRRLMGMMGLQAIYQKHRRQTRITGSIRTCFAVCQLSVPIRSGAPTSPISLCAVVLCTWWR
jgi:putative transposase